MVGAAAGQPPAAVQQAQQLHRAGGPRQDVSCDTLQFTASTRKGSHAQEAWITADELPIFLRNEGLRGRCSFTTSRERKNPAPPTRVTATITKSSTTYHCCFGPEDQNVGTSSGPNEQQHRRRRGKLQEGRSQKVGCQCKSTLTGYWQRPGEYKVQQAQHLNKQGKLCHVPRHGAGAQADTPRLLHEPRLAPPCRAYVMDMLDKRLSAKAIVNNVREAVVKAAMHVQGGGAGRAGKGCWRLCSSRVLHQHIGRVQHVQPGGAAAVPPRSQRCRECAPVIY